MVTTQFHQKRPLNYTGKVEDPDVSDLVSSQDIMQITQKL